MKNNTDKTLQSKPGNSRVENVGLHRKQAGKSELDQQSRAQQWKRKHKSGRANDNPVASCVQLSPAFSPLDNLEAMGAHNLSQITLPRPRRHWGIYIVSGRLGLIVAPRGAGKSTFIGACALSMAYKADFLGNEPAKQRRVIILDGEMDLHTMQERLKEQSQALGANIDNTHLKFISPELFDGIMPSLSTADGQREIDKVLGDQWDILFIDNYSAFSESGREDAESWMPWIRWMLRHKRAGRTVIVVHHTGKNGQQRGSSKHEDALDFSIALKPIPDDKHDGDLKFIFEWRKSRHLPSDQTRPFMATYAKTPDGYRWTRGHVDEANSQKMEAKKLLKDGVKPAAVAKQVGVNPSTISRWMKEKE